MLLPRLKTLILIHFFLMQNGWQFFPNQIQLGLGNDKSWIMFWMLDLKINSSLISIVYCPLRSCIFKVMFVWEKHKCLSNDETVYVWDNDTRLTLWQYGLWSFQKGGTNLERFLPKNQHTQSKLLNFENWVSGEVSKIGHHFSK